jgi:hypothetical protein
MKSYLSFVPAAALLAIFVLPAISAGAQGYGWSGILSNMNNATGKSVGVDAAGNVYFTAAFESAIDADPGPGTDTLHSGSSASRNLMCKLAPDGSYLWSDTTNATLYDTHAASLAVSPSGSCYLTGGSGVRIQKYNSDGSRLWDFLLTNTSLENYIAWHPSGYIYVVGTYADTVDFDPGPGDYNLTSATPGFPQTYVLKLDTNGTFIWAGSFAGTSNQQPNGLALDDAGNVYITGYFTNTVDFDPGVGVSNLTASGGTQDMFVCRLNADGSFGWVRQMGGSIDEIGWRIAMGPWNMLYVEEIRIPATGGTNFKNLLKMDTAGNTIWSRSLASLGISSMTADNAGSLLIAGTFAGTCDFDLGVGSMPLTASGFYSGYVMKTDTGLGLIWAQATQGVDSSSCSPNAVAVDGAGAIYTTGSFTRTVDFDPTAAIDTFTSVAPFVGSNPRSVFVSKWNPPVSGSPLSQQQRCRLYPNPATGIVHIETDHATGIGHWQVYDAVGRVAQQGYEKHRTATLDVNNLAPGIYIVRLENGLCLKLSIQ